MSGGGTQNLILSARTLQCKFQSFVIGLKRMGAGFKGRELVLEILHVPFFALAERALSVA
jgi:xanthine dehydrogenase molybdopterin-binding subunit B